MADKRDYYDVLGVKRSASAEEIRSAYRKLARQYHPDVNKEEDAPKRFAEVQEAYDVLSDEEKRKAYDRFGHAGVGAAGGAGGPGGAQQGYGPGGARWTYTSGGQGAAGTHGFDDLGSIFEQMFSGAAGGGGAGSPFGAGARQRTRGPHAQPRPRKGRDLTHTLTVAFNTAALGGTQQIRLTRDGKVETIDVKVPAGIESGAKLRVRGKGETAAGAQQPGDLILTIDVAPHPYFRRDGLNILIDVPINIAEAAKGVKVNVPLLKGTAELTIPPGASSGQKLRLKGKGITDARGRIGDYLAVVQIVAPKKLSDRGAKLIDDLAGELQNPRHSAPWADNI